MTSNSHFRKRSAIYTCQSCLCKTRETGSDESSYILCVDCFELAGIYNAYLDGHNITNQKDEIKERCERILKKGGQLAPDFEELRRPAPTSSRMINPGQSTDMASHTGTQTSPHFVGPKLRSLPKETQKVKPLIYIASPYTQGSLDLNVRFQLEVFDTLLSDGKVTPIAPLWAHFQHIAFPRPYQDWIRYDEEIVARCDGCLRLDARNANLDYHQRDSVGADAEVRLFLLQSKPVFFSILSLYSYCKEINE